jgi:hypothetical protein
MAFTPCGCDRCEARRIEHPPLANGCPCPECQPGPGLNPERDRHDRLERVLGPITKVIIRDWCPTCQEITIVESVRSGPDWVNTCPDLHTWRSFT